MTGYDWIELGWDWTGFGPVETATGRDNISTGWDWRLDSRDIKGAFASG
jgi:hypothetical protein